MRRIFSLAGHAILAMVIAILLSWIFPSLAGSLDPPSYPFRYIVSLEDTLTMVEASSSEKWIALNLERKEVRPEECKCPPKTEARSDLSHLQQHSNLEMIELEVLGGTHFQLNAHRDDLGSPPIAYLYACDAENRIRPMMRYESFFGFVYPVLGWRYFATVIGVWLSLVLVIGRLRSKSK